MPKNKILAKVYTFLRSLFPKEEAREDTQLPASDLDAANEVSEGQVPLSTSDPEFDSDALGEASEAKVFDIITEMTIRNEVPTRKKGTMPYRTGKFSKLDMSGVDIVVPTKRGDIHVQVKSSKFRWNNFVRDRRNKDIICVNIQDGEVEIIKELRNKLRIAYERMEPARTSDHA